MNSSNLQTLNFPVAFTTTNYWGIANFIWNNGTEYGWGYIYERSQTYCKFAMNDKFLWHILGY